MQTAPQISYHAQEPRPSQGGLFGGCAALPVEGGANVLGTPCRTAVRDYAVACLVSVALRTPPRRRPLQPCIRTPNVKRLAETRRFHRDATPTSSAVRGASKRTWGSRCYLWYRQSARTPPPSSHRRVTERRSSERTNPLRSPWLPHLLHTIFYTPSPTPQQPTTDSSQPGSRATTRSNSLETSSIITCTH